MTNSEEQTPRHTSLGEVVGQAFNTAAEDSNKFRFEQTTDTLGLPREKVTYFTDGGVRVVIYRNSLDVEELRALDNDPHSRTPQAEVEVNAKRPFTLYLANNERYYARAGYCGVGLFDDGVFVDRFATAYRSFQDDTGTLKTELAAIGSFYVPLETESD